MQDSSTPQGEVLGRLRDGNGGATQSHAGDSSAVDPYLHDQARWVGRSRDDAESVSTYSSASTWTKFLQHYSFNYDPDYCLKVRKSNESAKLGVNVLWPSGYQDQPQLSLIAKPRGRAGEWLHRLTVSPEEGGRLQLLTPKLQLSILRVQLAVQASRERGIQFNYKCELQDEVPYWLDRATTKFGSVGKSQVYKQQVSLPWLSQRGVNFGVRPHVKVNMFLPEVTGSFGSEGREREVDEGFCHIHVPRVHLRWDLDGCKPASRKLLSGPAEEVEEHADTACVKNMIP